MKIITILCFVLCFSSVLYSSDYSVFPLRLEYFGSVATSKNIIAYGNYGKYSMTTDKGKSWKIYSIGETENIRKIICDNDTLWGLIETGEIIKSIDHGVNWERYKIKLKPGEEYYAILAVDKYLFVKSDTSIYKYDKNINLISELTNNDTRSGWNNYGFYDFIPQMPQRYQNDIYYVNNSIVYNAPYTSIIVIDSNLSSSKRIKIDTLVYEKKVSFASIIDVFDYKGKKIINMNDNLYLCNQDFTKWEYFFKDTSFFNGYSSNKYDQYLCTKFFNIDSNLYVFLNTQSSDSLLIDFERKSNYIKNEFCIAKIDDFNSKIININSKYHEKFYSSKMDQWFPLAAGLTQLISIREKPTIFEDSIIVFTGYLNMIFQTRDFGKNWEMVSLNRGEPKQILNDSTYYFQKIDKKYTNDIFYTNDWGNTFHPTNLVDTNGYLSDYYKARILFIDENGKGFFTGSKKYTNEGLINNISVTNDYGKSFKSITCPDFHMLYPEDIAKFANIKRVENKYLIYFTDLSYSANYSMWYQLDTNMRDMTYFTYDSLYTIEHMLIDNLKNYEYLATVRENRYDQYLHTEIRETNDSGRTYKVLYKLDNINNIVQTYEHNSDSLFFISSDPTILFLYDRKNGKIDSLYKDTRPREEYYVPQLKLFVISNKFYLYGDSLFLENTNRKDLSKWEKGTWDYGHPIIYDVIFKGNVAIACMEDSLRKKNYYRILPKVMPVSVTNDTEVKYGKHFYASASYPMPGKNVVRSRISYDESFDLEESLNGVYNTYGERIEGKENLRVIKWGHAQAEIEWNCSQAPSGVYFIIVKHNGRNDCVPVIVER